MVSVLVVVPASASPIIYCNDSDTCGANNETAFENAITSAGLFFPSGLQNFSSDTSMAYPGMNGLSNANGITGLSFLGYINTGSGTPPEKGVTVSGNNLVQSTGDTGSTTALEIQLPSSVVYALAANVTVTSSYGQPCIEPNVTAATFNNSNCNTQTSISSSTDTEFFGVIDVAPLNDVFLGYAFSAGNGPLEIESFELGEQTPEVATLLMIGTGLTFLGALRRRRLRKAHGELRQETPQQICPRDICRTPAAAQ
jgi:hypothetical protein